ncbi:hypothetical protein QTA57_11205 [Fontisubflavum oceani]|uniref:hypothetical protein n=1 Tax=Fontisubflavum oceani TaxID=2978973 RepID=UPI0025B31BA6|nr:hypothetical protein [Fontisubflavum oceani]WJY20426.1 hypothetical protein QTA57_11205 [Fontisubflavum oceani]
MTLEKQFKLEAVERPKTTSPVHQRRMKFISAIDKQLTSLTEDGSGKGARGRGWVWQSEAGEWFVSPRYGRSAIKLAPGMKAIKCADEKDVIDNLAKLKALASDGKLDKVLEAAAADIRSRFAK